MKRRELIQWLVATAGLRALDGLAPADLFALGRDIHRHTTPHTAGRTLTAHAEQTVTIAAERIIPATETPGATDAGVGAFIEKMLTDWHTPAERERFLAGLLDLDARCRARASRDFVACSRYHSRLSRCFFGVAGHLLADHCQLFRRGANRLRISRRLYCSRSRPLRWERRRAIATDACGVRPSDDGLPPYIGVSSIVQSGAVRPPDPRASDDQRGGSFAPRFFRASVSQSARSVRFRNS